MLHVIKVSKIEICPKNQIFESMSYRSQSRYDYFQSQTPKNTAIDQETEKYWIFRVLVEKVSRVDYFPSEKQKNSRNRPRNRKVMLGARFYKKITHSLNVKKWHKVTEK